MTNTEIIVNLATIIANQRLEISELKTEVEHLHHELLAMRVEADEPQTDCAWGREDAPRTVPLYPMKEGGETDEDNSR